MIRIQYVHCDTSPDGAISAEVWCAARCIMSLRDSLDISVKYETIVYGDQRGICVSSRQCSV
jgi:hypothetical protein